MRRAVLALLCVAACDSSGSSFDVAQFDDALKDKFCDLLVHCGFLEDDPLCHSLQLDSTSDPRSYSKIDADLIAALDAGKVIYHSDKAHECVASYAAASCDQTQFGRIASPACDDVFEGTVGDGVACAMSEECISKVCGVGDCAPESCCHGTCFGATEPVRPRLGESCAADIRCVDSFCDTTTTTCLAYRAVGMPCQSPFECAFGSTCDETATCAPVPNTGEACTSICLQLADYCDPTSLTCTRLGIAGDPCTTDEVCSPFYGCDTEVGQCKLRSRVGDPCGDSVGGTCVDRSFCDSATLKCTAPRANGAPCNGSGQCASRACDYMTATCIAYPACI